MKISCKIFAPLAAIAVLAGAQVASAATDQATYRILDMQRVLVEANAAKSALSQIEAEGGTFKKYISGKQEGLHKRYKGLEENRSLLSPKDFEEKKNTLNKELVKFQSEIQAKRKSLNVIRQNALKKINEETVKIVAKMAGKKKFNITFLRSQVFFYDKKLDITKTVIAQLNTVLPEIPKAPTTPATSKTK